MPKFHTAYDPAEIKNKHKVYDTHDNVDRISYVDSTRLIERFIAEGHDLNMARAKALRSGLYSGDMREIANDDGIIVPVYDTDPALLGPVIESAKSRLAANVASRKGSLGVSSNEATSSPNNGENADTGK